MESAGELSWTGGFVDALESDQIESDEGGLIDKEREGMNKGVAACTSACTFEENWGCLTQRWREANRDGN